MYVDSHQHFWKLSRGDYAWMSEEYKPLYRDFFPKDLIDLINKKNISKTVIIFANNLHGTDKKVSSTIF